MQLADTPGKGDRIEAQVNPAEACAVDSLRPNNTAAAETARHKRGGPLVGLSGSHARSIRSVTSLATSKPDPDDHDHEGDPKANHKYWHHAPSCFLVR